MSTTEGPDGTTLFIVEGPGDEGGCRDEWVIGEGRRRRGSAAIVPRTHVVWEGIDRYPTEVMYENLVWILSSPGLLAPGAVFTLRPADPARLLSMASLLESLPYWRGGYDERAAAFRFRCTTPPPCSVRPAIVSAIYDIRAMEGHTGADHDSKKIDLYLSKGEEHLSRIDPDIPLIVFTSTSLYDRVTALLTRDRPRETTFIIPIEFRDTKYAQYETVVRERQGTYNIANRHKDKDTPLYILLMCNKMFFLEEAMRRFAHQDITHWAWMDFGIGYVADNTRLLHSWIYRIPDKIRLMAVTPWDRMYPTDGRSTREHDRDLHTFWYHFVAGGLFTASTVYMDWLVRHFEDRFRRILLVDDYYQNDQVILSMLARDYPDNFTLYFGDYPAIIENYLFPKSFRGLIECHANRCTDTTRHGPVLRQLEAYLARFYPYHPDHEMFYQSFVRRTGLASSAIASRSSPHHSHQIDAESLLRIPGLLKASVRVPPSTMPLDYIARTILPVWGVLDPGTPCLIARAEDTTTEDTEDTGDTENITIPAYRVQWLHKNILVCA